MSIFSVRHQPKAHHLIQRALAGDRIPHAYIFHGPDGVGKETFAVQMANLLLCPHPRDVDDSSDAAWSGWSDRVRDACGECEDCRAVRAETHPDLHAIYRQLNRFHPDTAVRNRKALDLGVDVIRHFVIDRVGAKPARGRAKVFIIRQADRITPAAQNALLKTLEEPPATTFMILLVSSLERLLATTYSRCQVIPFAPLPRDFILETLSELRSELTSEQAAFIAEVAQGSLGVALQHADDELSAHNSRIVSMLAQLDSARAIGAARELIEGAKALGGQFRKRDPDISDTEAQRQGLKTLLCLMAAWYRGAMHRALGTAHSAAGPRSVDAPPERGTRLHPEAAADAISTISTAERQLDLNANVQLCLEALLFKLARLTSAG